MACIIENDDNSIKIVFHLYSMARSCSLRSQISGQLMAAEKGNGEEIAPTLILRS
jgi:hypothetical protein